MARFLAGCAGAACGLMWAGANTAAAYEKPPKGAFTHEFKHFRLGEIITLAENVAIFRFLMPNADDVFHLEPCATLQCRFSTGSNIIENVTRAYTPINRNGTKGYFDLLVKKQPHGRMTESLFAMEVGEPMAARVVGHKLRYTPNKYKAVGMIGGGTGITPLLQVIRAVLDNPADKTKISLLFANTTDHKILLHGELEAIKKAHPEQFATHYTVDRAVEPEKWTGYIGHVDRKKVQETMPPPSKDNLLLICGPDAMITALAGVPQTILSQMSGSRPMQPVHTHLNNLGELSGLLGSMGYDSEQVYRF